jgi:hypothetical protein
VFGFLLYSYAVGFWIVERTKRNAVVVENVEEKAEEGMVAWIGILTVRILYEMGIPVENLLTGSREVLGDCLGVPSFLGEALSLHKEESIASLSFRAVSTVVNRFGSIIYIMFFLVVHLMKLHSLSLIWGVTAEAMEYEENAERRRQTMKEKEEDRMSMTKSRSAGGLVLCGGGGFGKGNVEEKPMPSQSQGSGGKTSHSALRLKRLGFVGFGGTLGGILGR